MKRIFAAIDVSEAARRAVSGRIESLRGEFSGARAVWTKAEKLHLTLKFLGETDDEGLEKFIRAIENAARKFSPFKLQIGGAGVFPSARNARVLWLDVRDENNNLQKLSECLEEECRAQGFPKENRAFKAHLTIARLKQKPDASLIEKHLNASFPPLEAFEASEITIYASQLLPHGSRYTVISKSLLAVSAKW